MKSLFLAFFLFLSIGLKAQDTLPYMLLMDEKIQIEATDAVNDVYNFKFEKAGKQFQILKLKYPDHPMPYFLMGLGLWWKMMPNLDHELDDTKNDETFNAYMDTSITLAEKLFDKNEKNVEAAFFLAGAYGFKARLYGERRNYARGTLAAKNALKYMQITTESELSPEFEFGKGLYNYYAVWIKENFPLLRPIIMFFPDGNKELGIKQLKEVSYNAFYTRTEAQYFLVRIYTVEESKDMLALPIARYLATTFPDNPYFARQYARCAYMTGQSREYAEASLEILRKIDKGMEGYEEVSGRYASFYLGQYFYNQGNIIKAKEYYNLTVAFAKKIDAIHTGYYLHALKNLAIIAEKEKDEKTARKLWKTVKKDSDKDNKKLKQEAKGKLNPKKEKPGKEKKK
jgi:hypothetical protein